MSKRFLVILLFLGLLASVFFLPGGGAKEAAGLPNFTIPTRTPTGQPTSPPAPTNTPQPTNTPAPPATAQPTNPAQPTDQPPPPPPPDDTATPIPAPPTETASPTTAAPLAPPSGGSWPTAVACGIPPTIQTQSGSRVRSGPGTDYAIVTDLPALAVRLIVGRAANAPWWLIQLDAAQTGWIADSVVQVQGYTGAVPLVDPPLINGQTPTPGAPWQPTAVPNCPTLTPSATNTATAVRPSPTASNLPIAATATTAPDTLLAADSPERSDTATSVVPTTGPSTSAARTENEAPPAATAAPLSDPGRSANNQSSAASVPCATALIGIAAVFFVGRRRTGNS